MYKRNGVCMLPQITTFDQRDRRDRENKNSYIHLIPVVNVRHRKEKKIIFDEYSNAVETQTRIKCRVISIVKFNEHRMKYMASFVTVNIIYSECQNNVQSKNACVPNHRKVPNSKRLDLIDELLRCQKVRANVRQCGKLHV
ncbi:hypothetical protein KQX54_018251 [Cotesia glomerata]|uniref:Uncharacterized protein n=1 Tax=Cotesia glomerata TaxID=32391 RepID=A0AAV7IRQ8_COTGL|nr:hypothetical protein KQX54_018251 [Cotesia glomerata]